MNNSPIGIFDSGVGGLSVFSELVKLMPNEKYIYYGDTANLPYGDKSKEELIEITRGIFKFFELHKVKAVIMACNTTSALIYESVKSLYDYKIYPLVQTVSKNIADCQPKKIGVLATNATINSHAYKNEILKYSPHVEVYEHACPAWVPIVEKGLTDTEESVEQIKSDVLSVLRYNPDKIILGCTHYPYLLKTLVKYAPIEAFVNPAIYFALNIYNDLKSSDMLTEMPFGSRIFYVSGSVSKFIAASKIFYDLSSEKVESSSFYSLK